MSFPRESDCIDFGKILENLNKGNIAFSKPRQMQLGSTELITLLVSPDIDEAELRRRIAEDIDLTGGTANVAITNKIGSGAVRK